MLGFNLTPLNVHYFLGFARPRIIIIFNIKLKMPPLMLSPAAGDYVIDYETKL